MYGLYQDKIDLMIWLPWTQLLVTVRSFVGFFYQSALKNLYWHKYCVFHTIFTLNIQSPSGYIYRLSWELAVKNVFVPSEKGSTLKGKNLLPKSRFLFEISSTPKVANSFFRADPFQKGFDMQESKQEIKKIVPLVKNGSKCTMYIPWSPLEPLPLILLWQFYLNIYG